MSGTPNARILLSAQTLAPGNGGVGAVARMTVMALAPRFSMEALACQDVMGGSIDGVDVRGFSSRRLAFAAANLRGTRRATHVIYDHAGTARAHVDLPLAGRPYAVWLHGWEVWHEPRADYIRALRGARLVLANSNYTVRRAGAALSGMRVVVCELGTHADSAPPQAPSEGPSTVMLLGRADEMFAKGHDILIDIWPAVVSAVPDARLLLVGGGPALGRLQKLVAASPARGAIEVAGFVPDEALDGYWWRATVLAMPGFAEGFGLVYAEAMRRAVPVIASTDDGGQEVNVDGVTGFNVARRDTHRLTDVVVSLLRDRDHVRALGAAAQTRWRDRYRFSAFTQRLMTATADFL
jgi:phosphatidylinositol alpha-1,6-mannosyltransferase